MKEIGCPYNVTVEKAKALLLEHAKRIETEYVKIEEARGRVLACEVIACENIPPFDKSPLDGYTFKAEETAEASKERPVELLIQEEVPAGSVASTALKTGYAFKILTGSPIPEGCNCVIRYEDTEFTEQSVKIFSPQKPDSNIVLEGSDIRSGDVLMRPGKVLDAADLGVLAGLGYTEIQVYRKVTITLISTGDELVMPGEALSPGKIRNSSAYLLKGMLEQYGFDVKLYGNVKDSLEKVVEAMEEAAREADIVLTTGGASVGDYDFVLEGMKGIGAQPLFWKVRMKPGMATLAAVRAGQLFIGLSGNPSSAVAALYQVAMAALFKVSGRENVEFQKIEVEFLDDFKKKSPGGRVIPGRLKFVDGRLGIQIRPRQENGMIGNWAGCDVLALVPPQSGPVWVGMKCEAVYLK